MPPSIEEAWHTFSSVTWSRLGGTEEGEFPYPISFAEIGNLVARELNARFLTH